VYLRVMASRRRSHATGDAERAWERLRDHALSLPEAWEDFPWGDHAVKVRKKIFVFLGSKKKDELRLTVKLPASCAEVLRNEWATPTGYGLGKSGWVSVTIPAGELPPQDVIEDWLEESYQAVAPKRLGRLLDPDLDVTSESAKTSKRASKKTSKRASTKSSERAAAKTSKHASKKTSKRAAAKTSKHASKKTSKRAAKKTSETSKHAAKKTSETSKRASKKTSKRAAKKTSETSKRAAKKTSKRATKKASKKTPKRASKKTSKKEPKNTTSRSRKGAKRAR